MPTSRRRPTPAPIDKPQPSSVLPSLVMWSLALFAGFVVTASLATFVTDLVTSSDGAVIAVLTGVSALARVGFGLLIDS